MKLDLAKILDEYDLRARLLPALIVSAPPLAAAVTCIPAATSEWIFLTPLLEVPFVYLLMHMARTEGYKIEDRLFATWGGKPTTAMLRHRDTRIDPMTKERYKTTITELAEIKFPAAADESADAAKADAAYGSAIRRLIEFRRGEGFPLVFKENCNYGFARNLLGLKNIGLMLALVSLVAESGVAWFQPDRFAPAGELAILLALAVAAMLAFYVTPETVRHHAEAYAIALLRTCEPRLEMIDPIRKALHGRYQDDIFQVGNGDCSLTGLSDCTADRDRL